MNSSIREILKDKKRIVIKIGSSSLTHPETGALNLTKLEVLVREISDLHNMGKDVIVVSSGAIAVGRRAAGLGHRPSETKEKQACAAIGQARLMMIYQKLFNELYQYEKQGVYMEMEGSPASPTQIVRAHMLRENTGYMRDYVLNENGDIKELYFHQITNKET